LDDPWCSTHPLDRIPQFTPEMGDAATADMPEFDHVFRGEWMSDEDARAEGLL
jgi:hypothetical protein